MKQIRLFLSLLAILVSGSASAQTYTPVYDSNTASDFASTRAAVGAGQVLVNGNLDALGSSWTTGGGTVQTSSTAFQTAWLVRQASEAVLNGKGVFTAVGNNNNYVIGLARVNTSARTGYMVYANNTSLSIGTVSAGGSPVFAGGGAGLSYTGSFPTGKLLTILVHSTDSTHTTITANIADSATPGTIVATYTVIDTTVAEQSAGVFGVAANALPYSRIQTFSEVGPAFGLSPTSVATSSAGNTLTLTGTATAWTSGTTFAATAGTITAQSINASTQVATLTYTAPVSAGSITFSDNADAATAALAVTGSTSVTAGAVTLTSATATALTLNTAVATGGTGPYSYQWYKSATSGFTPGAGTLLAGATGSQYVDSAAQPGTVYFYRVVATDSVAATGTSVQVSGALGQPGYTVLFIGDSITYGYSLASPATMSAPVQFQSQLSLLLGGAPVTIYNAGQNGTTTTNWLPSGSYLTPAEAQASGAARKYAVVTLSTNNARGDQQITAATTLSDLTAITSHLIGQGFTVILNYPPFFVPESFMGFTSLGFGLLTSYHAGIDSLINGTTILRGDTSAYTFFANNPSLLGDGLHPVQAGAFDLGTFWAKAFYKSVVNTATISAAPLTLTATAGSNSEVLTWTADSGATNGYEVDWKPSSVLPVAGQVKSIVAIVGPGVLTWTDTSAYRLAQSGRYNVVGLH